MEAGFVHVVEVGQYFITKDTDDFGQFHHHNQEDGFKETREFGLY